MAIEEEIQALLSEFEESPSSDQEIGYWRAWLEMGSSALDGRPTVPADIVDRWPQGPSAMLDFVAGILVNHPDWDGSEQDARGWLSMLTSSSRIAHHLGGEPRHVLRELRDAPIEQAKIQGQAMLTIWQEGMLTSSAAAEALGANPRNREKVSRARTHSDLLGLPQAHRFLYPDFQFDLERRQIFPVVEAVNRRLNAAQDPWGVASWWFSRHDRLGARPADLVGTRREDALSEVADAAVEPIG